MEVQGAGIRRQESGIGEIGLPPPENKNGGSLQLHLRIYEMRNRYNPCLKNVFLRYMDPDFRLLTSDPCFLTPDSYLSRWQSRRSIDMEFLISCNLQLKTNSLFPNHAHNANRIPIAHNCKNMHYKLDRGG